PPYKRRTGQLVSRKLSAGIPKETSTKLQDSLIQLSSLKMTSLAICGLRKVKVAARLSRKKRKRQRKKLVEKPKLSCARRLLRPRCLLLYAPTVGEVKMKGSST